MRVEYAIQEGWPSQQAGLRNRIGALAIRPQGKFKIGITNAPEDRMKQYGGGFDRMIVLYKTSSWDNVRKLERNLIDSYLDYDGNRNLKSGGGGRKPAEGPYYLYVVVGY